MKKNSESIISSLAPSSKKKGQVFLMGAMLLILVLITLVAFENKVVKNSPNYRFDFLANNIKQEMAHVVEHDIKNKENNLENFINLTADYLFESYPQSNLYFIYGNTSSVKTIMYTDESRTETFNSSVDNITIELNDENYVAKLYSSTQVYFAIEKIEKDGVYIGFA